MAFGLAACHRPRGACAARGLAERGLAADARTPQRRLQALPPAPLTVKQAGKPDPCKKSACEIPYHAGAELEEQTWGAHQPHKHRGVSKHEFPLSLHILLSRAYPFFLSRRKESFPSPMSCEEPEGCRALVVSTEPNPGLEAGSVHGAELGREADPAGRGAQRLCDMRVTITPLACTHIRDILTLREEQKK